MHCAQIIQAPWTAAQAYSIVSASLDTLVVGMARSARPVPLASIRTKLAAPCVGNAALALTLRRAVLSVSASLATVQLATSLVYRAKPVPISVVIAIRNPFLPQTAHALPATLGTLQAPPWQRSAPFALLEPFRMPVQHPCVNSAQPILPPPLLVLQTRLVFVAGAFTRLDHHQSVWLVVQGPFQPF